MKTNPDEHQAPAMAQMREVLDHLLKVKADDVVTITAPFDRHRPKNDANRIGLRNLVATAKAQVVERCEPNVAAAIVKRLDEAVSNVDFGAGAYGVVVVATVDMTEIHLLPFPVRPATAVTSTPSVRLLAQGLVRSPRYRLLVVSDRATRLFEGVRDDVIEIDEHGFPFTADVVRRDMRAVAGRFAQPTGRDDKEQWRNFYRRVDQALTEASRDDPLPIVLAGVRRSTGLFQEISRNADHVIGRLDGAREHANAHELGEAAWQILRDQLKERRGTAIARLSEMFHAGSAALGIANCAVNRRFGVKIDPALPAN